MNIQEVCSTMKTIYDFIIEFIESEEDYGDENFNKLTDYIRNQKVFDNSDDFQEFMAIINKISKNHNRKPNLIHKTERIIAYYQDQIKHFFSNNQIFDFFKNNKIILLFLIRQKIVNIDSGILHNYILNEKYINYKFYFFNEIKEIISIEMKDSIIKEMDSKKITEIEEEKLTIGENDKYICSLIRNDLIDDFIIYVNQSNTPLYYVIPPSIYETNSLLIGKNISMIEYAAFFGSMQIIRYLYINKVELTPSMWLYAIHSRNAELVHFLEENHVIPNDETYEKCYKESIKCHHNDFANYIFDNKLIIIEKKQKIKEESSSDSSTGFFKNIFNKFFKVESNNNNDYNYDYSVQKINIIRTIYRYHNYDMMQTFFDDPINYFHFFCFCEFNYLNLVKLLIITKKVNINTKLIYNEQNEI